MKYPQIGLITAAMVGMSMGSAFAGPVADPYTMSPPASTGFNPYAPTLCQGSWDGVGKTACELLGGPGAIGKPLLFTTYGEWEFYFSLTAHTPTGLIVESNGSLTYSNDRTWYNSLLHPEQFAFWEDEEKVIVGVEDLLMGDFDYNDFMVEFSPASVPEPSLLTAFGLALLAFARKLWNKEIL